MKSASLHACIARIKVFAGGLTAVWCLLLIGALWSAPAAAATPQRVQVVASYHAGLAWSDEQIAGVREQLARLSPPVELRLDFLDTKHVQPTEAYYKLTEELLLAKYGRQTPGVLIAIDDDALDFVVRLRERHFKTTPIFFSGVSSSRRTDLERLVLVGGVFDDLDVGDSLQQMLRMRPQTERVVVLHDQSRTSLAQVAALRERMAGNSGVTLDYLSDLPIATIQQRLSTLRAQDLVFALPFNRDADGLVLTHEEATDLWTKASKAPVAVTRDVAMRPGVLGGFLINGYEQGTTLGNLVVRWIQGGLKAPLPLLESGSHATFDHEEMLRWGIDPAQLPPGATLIHRHEVAMDSLRPHIPWLSVLFGSMLVIIGLLLHMIRVRHRAARALELSARNYQELFEHSPDAIMVRDAQTGHIVQTNSRFCQLFGYREDELSTLLPADLSSGEPGYGGKEALGWIEKTRKEGAQFFEWRSRRKDGSVFWSEISMTRFEMAQGQRTVSSIRDISDRKQAEVLVKEFEHRLQQVYQNLPIAVFAIDANHLVTFWNPQMTRLTGVDATQIVGTTDTWRGIYPQPRPCLADVLVDGTPHEELLRLYPSRLRESPIIPGALEGEDYFASMDGSQGMWIRFCAAPLRDSEGKITGAIETLIDVTRLKRTQKTLEDLNRDLEARVEARNAELRQAMGQLMQSEKMAALGSLVAGVAHELNTPIGNVMAVATTLRDDVNAFSQKLLSGAARRSDVEKSTERLQEASTLIERNATRAAKLINDFKEVAVDQSSTRRRQFVLLDIVNDVLTTTNPLFRNTPYQIDLQIPSDLALDSYPGPLEQVLTNFLSNSLKHGFEGMDEGRITIAARQDGSHIVLEYADNGCGIPKANLPHIFEPFFTTKLGRGGSGLGLYIVYNIVCNVLGGSVVPHSPPGGGTRFVLRLPVNGPQPVPFADSKH